MGGVGFNGPLDSSWLVSSSRPKAPNLLASLIAASCSFVIFSLLILRISVLLFLHRSTANCSLLIIELASWLRGV